MAPKEILKYEVRAAIESGGGISRSNETRLAVVEIPVRIQRPFRSKIIGNCRQEYFSWYRDRPTGRLSGTPHSKIASSSKIFNNRAAAQSRPRQWRRWYRAGIFREPPETDKEEEVRAGRDALERKKEAGRRWREREDARVCPSPARGSTRGHR